jgi:hypothetical protein
MGLDIRINTTKIDELYAIEPKNDYFLGHSLSRTFCNVICRKGAFAWESELVKIGKIVGVDVQPFFDMEDYLEDSDLEERLNHMESEVEKLNFQKRVSDGRTKLEGNIDKILNLIGQLIERLSQTDDLSKQLIDEYESQYNNKDKREIMYYVDFDYFSDFKIDKGKGYMGNNFGQDLRNFKRFLEFAKGNGRTTVWFHYG